MNLESENISKMIKKHFSFYFLLFLFILPKFSFTQEKSSLSLSLDSLFSNDFFKTTIVAIDIYDLTDNKKLYSKNETLLLHPASIQKILSTSAALIFLDDYKFQTKILCEGDIMDSVCNGNLFIVGGCDPLFSLWDLDSLVYIIKKIGIKKVNGNLLADISMTDSLHWGEGWMWDDNPSPHAAFISPLSINKNIFNVIFRPSNIESPLVIETIPKTSYFEINNTSLTTENTDSNFIITKDWINNKDKIIVSGKISIKSAEDTLTFSVANPAKFFLTLFKEKLFDNGIIINGSSGFNTAPENATHIFTLERELDSVIVYTNKMSYNLGAELILHVLAFKYFGKPASARNGIKLIDSLITLAGFNPKNFKMVDGSGLSFYNLVSAELITAILKYLYYEKEKLFIKLYNSFPISGYDGTLKKRMHNSSAFRKVRAKTGTLSGISNLAGYMFNHQNHLIAFCILMQNFTTSAKTARDFQDKICEMIYNSN